MIDDVQHVVNHELKSVPKR